jgi:hypothetical protein
MLRALGCLGGALLVAGILILGWQVEYGTEQTVTFTVKSLDDQSTGSSGHQYLVFTTDGTEYADTDSWPHGKTDSSDIYNWLTVGHKYRCPVYGWRNHITSSYEDILDGCRDITPGVPANLQTVP